MDHISFACSERRNAIMHEFRTRDRFSNDFLFLILQNCCNSILRSETKLERLGREIRDMDREADELLAQFSVAADQYGQWRGRRLINTLAFYFSDRREKLRSFYL